jgi:manganese-dependent inorganic pyrophosphatase
VLALDAHELGREMFESTADVSEVSAEEIVSRDAKRYQVRGGQEICIAQIEVVGSALLNRREELLEAMRSERASKELALYALMVTDVLDKGTEMLVAGDVGAVARSLGVEHTDGMIDLPGVMSRKKEVAPKLMTAL